jgi:hypothetical protein
MFVFKDNFCTYPAQNINNLLSYMTPSINSTKLLENLKTHDQAVMINRRFIDKMSNSGKVTTYWTSLRDGNGDIFGAVGLQSD